MLLTWVLIDLRFVTHEYVAPNGVKKLLNFVDEEVIKDGGYQRNKIEINWHGHQDRGLGVINNLAAYEAGADCIHGTALGLGEVQEMRRLIKLCQSQVDGCNR